jgi:hypothetical protein
VPSDSRAAAATRSTQRDHLHKPTARSRAGSGPATNTAVRVNRVPSDSRAATATRSTQRDHLHKPTAKGRAGSGPSTNTAVVGIACQAIHPRRTHPAPPIATTSRIRPRGAAQGAAPQRTQPSWESRAKRFTRGERAPLHPSQPPREADREGPRRERPLNEHSRRGNRVPSDSPAANAPRSTHRNHLANPTARGRAGSGPATNTAACQAIHPRRTHPAPPIATTSPSRPRGAAQGAAQPTSRRGNRVPSDSRAAIAPRSTHRDHLSRPTARSRAGSGPTHEPSWESRAKRFPRGERTPLHPSRPPLQADREEPRRERLLKSAAARARPRRAIRRGGRPSPASSPRP